MAVITSESVQERPNSITLYYVNDLFCGVKLIKSSLHIIYAK